MAELPKPTDPDNVPVRVVNAISAIGLIGGCVDIVLSTGRYVPGETQAELVVCARLRFDMEMAKIIRRALDDQIALLTPPTDVKAN